MDLRFDPLEILKSPNVLHAFDGKTLSLSLGYKTGNSSAGLVCSELLNQLCAFTVFPQGTIKVRLVP